MIGPSKNVGRLAVVLLLTIRDGQICFGYGKVSIEDIGQTGSTLISLEGGFTWPLP